MRAPDPEEEASSRWAWPSSSAIMLMLWREENAASPDARAEAEPEPDGSAASGEVTISPTPSLLRVACAATALALPPPKGRIPRSDQAVERGRCCCGGCGAAGVVVDGDAPSAGAATADASLRTLSAAQAPLPTSSVPRAAELARLRDSGFMTPKSDGRSLERRPTATPPAKKAEATEPRAPRAAPLAERLSDGLAPAAAEAEVESRRLPCAAPAA